MRFLFIINYDCSIDVREIKLLELIFFCNKNGWFHNSIQLFLLVKNDHFKLIKIKKVTQNRKDRQKHFFFIKHTLTPL